MAARGRFAKLRRDALRAGRVWTIQGSMLAPAPLVWWAGAKKTPGVTVVSRIPGDLDTAVSRIPGELDSNGLDGPGLIGITPRPHNIKATTEVEHRGKDGVEEFYTFSWTRRPRATRGTLWLVRAGKT